MGSYPTRSLLQQEALAVIPTIAFLAARKQLDVRAVEGNVQVLSQRGGFVRTLTRGDWEKIEDILSRPEVASSLGRIRTEKDPFSVVIGAYKDLLENLIINEYPSIGG